MPGPRIIAIDVVRGFAILWVLLYHLWTDLRYPNVYPQQADAFRAVPQRVAGGDAFGTLTAISDAFLRVGYLGVPLFMMLSGLSLTLVAMRRAQQPPYARFLWRRLRRVMTPYWFGFAFTLAFAAALAFVQWQRHGGDTYRQYLQNGDISVDGGQLLAGGLLLPRILRDEWQFAPEGSLWFVLVIVQYYLLFPLLLPVLKRAGPAPFAAGALTVTVASLVAMVAAGGSLVGHTSWVEMAAPFRLFEFGLGMAAGYALAARRDAFGAAARVQVAAPCVLAGAALFVAGCMIPLDGGYVPVAREPLVVAGMALVFLPLLAKAPSRIDATVPVRAIASVGVVSYAMLIINEPLRSVTHTMSAERASEAWIGAWIAGGFIPLTLLLARPLAVLLGLIEREAPPLTVGDLIGAGAPEPAAEALLYRRDPM